MKKNILTIVVLAATLINLTLTAVCLFVVVPTATKANNLITKVASILELEVEGVPLQVTDGHVALEDQLHIPIPDEMTIPLAKVEGETKNHAIKVKVIITLNKKAEDFETVQKQLEENIEVVKARIQDIITTYTSNNIGESKKIIAEQIRDDLRQYFDSEAIFEISFNGYVYS